MVGVINPHRRFHSLLEAVGARRELGGGVIWHGTRRLSNQPEAWLSPKAYEEWTRRIKREAWRVTRGERPSDNQFRWRRIR